MAITNYATRQVEFKVILYGPPSAGKSTCLNYIRENADLEERSEITTLKTGADKTIFCDFVLDELTVFEGFATKIVLYTVPGEVVFNAARLLLARDADGVLFVVDSQWDRIEAGAKSFQNLEENLKKNTLSIDSIPYVLLYNKRDLPEAAPVNYLNFVFNNREVMVPSFETNGLTGENVIAALNALCGRMLTNFAQDTGGEAVEALPKLRMSE